MTEAQVHQNIVDYLKLKHPSVIFRTDFSSGVKMTPGQAVKHKRMQSGRAFPDLFIYEPRGGFSGLAIELKADGLKILKQDGTLKRNRHIEEQAAMIMALKSLGYMAVFGIGFEHTRAIIDEYLKFKKPKNIPDYEYELKVAPDTGNPF